MQRRDAMDVLSRIRDVLSADKDEEQLDKFLVEVRDSLETTNRQFLTFSALTVGSLATYYLATSGGSTNISLQGIQITDSLLFRRVFLVVPASTMAAAACLGYLRRLQREVFDYLSISRYPILGKTGLHELRLPGDFVLGLFVLRTEGGSLGKLLGNLIALLCSATFVAFPAACIVGEAIKNVKLFGLGDFISLTASAVAILLAACGVLVAILAGRIKA